MNSWCPKRFVCFSIDSFKFDTINGCYYLSKLMLEAHILRYQEDEKKNENVIISCRIVKVKF